MQAAIRSRGMRASIRRPAQEKAGTLIPRIADIALGASHVDQQTLRILDHFLDADQEGHGLAPVDDAVIVA